jgi:glycerol-3-phosphate acyltransferase PlsX
MKIILDGMGGDNAPESIIDGAISAAAEIEDEIIIIGKEDILNETLRKKNYKGSQISVVNADEVITNEEAPVKAVRHKKESSLVKGITMVKEGQGDVFISAGSTGALLAGGLFILGRIGGIDRPTLATIYPVVGREPSILTDTGANAECKAKNLLEFAVMGSIYMEKVLGRTDPTVGLVNNGTEAGKGTTLTKEAYELLEQSDLNFIGNIETRELQDAVCDVIVTDGFTGNAIVKLTEGMGLMVLRELKRRFLSDTKSKLGALLLKDQLSSIKKEFNYAEYGGAPILGVRGALLKMHGSSDALAVKQTILKAIPYVEQDVVGTIENSISEIKESMESE